MSDRPPPTNKTPPSDLTLIDKLLKSNDPAHLNSAPSTPAKPQRPAPETPSELREKAAKAAEKCAPAMSTPPKPQCTAPPAPHGVPQSPSRAAPKAPKNHESDSEHGEGIYSAPPLKSPSQSIRAAPPPPASGSSSPMKQRPTDTKKRVSQLKNTIFPPLVTPETDSEDEGDGKYMMSGGLQGNDRSEREHSGRKPHKCNFREDLVQNEDVGDVGGWTTLLGSSAGGGERIEGQKHKGEAGRVNSRARRGSGSREKKEITVKRKHKRTTIGGNGRVVESESEEEYYESSGPVGGCVVA